MAKSSAAINYKELLVPKQGKYGFDWQNDLPTKEAVLTKEIFETLYNRRFGSLKHTIKAIVRDFAVAYEFINFSKKAIWNCTEEDFEAWGFEIGVTRGLLPSTQRHYQGVIRSLFDYIIGNQKYPNVIKISYGVSIRQICTKENCIPHVQDRESKRERPAFTHAQILDIFEALDNAILDAIKFSSKSLYPLMRDKAMFFLTYATGCRLSEVTGMKLDSFSPNPSIPAMGNYGYVTVKRKGSKGSGKPIQAVPIFDPSIPHLMDWYLTTVRPVFAIKADANEEALFLSERNAKIGTSTFEARFQNLMKIAGLEGKDLVPHCLRHTSVTHKNMGMSLEATRIIHGHKFAATTQAYNHIPDSYVEQEVRNMHDKMVSEALKG